MVVAQPEESFWKAVTCSTNCARASAPRQRSPFVQSPTGSAPSSTIALIWPDSTASSASLGECVPRPAAWAPSSLPAGVIRTRASRLWARWARMSAAAWLTRPFQISTDLLGPRQRTAQLGGRVGRGHQGRVRGAGGGRDVVRAAQRLQPGAAHSHRDHLRPAGDRLADAKLDHRRALAQLGVARDHDRRGGVEVGDRGQIGSQRVQARVSVGAAHADAARQAFGQDARPQVGLLVGLRARGQHRDRPGAELGGGGAQPLGHVLQRVALGDRLEPAAAADQRRGDAIGRAQLAQGIATAVAQPALVHLGMVARQHSHHVTLANRGRDVAAHGAAGAHGGDVLDLPGACLEAIGGRGQRSHRAQLGDVARELVGVRPSFEGGDHRVCAAVLGDQLHVAGDRLREPGAAIAEDAALAVELDQRRDRHRLVVGALGQRHAGHAGAVAEGQILQRALAALIAHGAVQRVVQEQELEHRVLAFLGPARVRVDHHAVGGAAWCRRSGAWACPRSRTGTCGRRRRRRPDAARSRTPGSRSRPPRRLPPGCGP